MSGDGAMRPENSSAAYRYSTARRENILGYPPLLRKIRA
jgi:hypothetical protein